MHDRLGVVPEVSSVMFELGGNILAISQTISKGWFTMIAYAEFSDNITESTIKSAIEEIGDLQVLVALHEVKMEKSDKSGDPFIVTVIGDDKAGIIKQLSQSFAQKKINIDDIWNEVCDDRIIVIFHIKMPPDIDPGEVRYDLLTSKHMDSN